MSGGAGTILAGIVIAGGDPAALPSSPPGAPLPGVLAFSRGTFAEVAPSEDDAGDGTYQAVSETVGRVRAALMVARGRVPAAPEMGFDWDTPFAVGDRLVADVTDRIHSALAAAG